MTAAPPLGVERGLWAEFQKLSKHIHDLNSQREDEDVKSPPTHRIVLNVPEEWFLLFAWIQCRVMHQRHGLDGSCGLTADSIILDERMLRQTVKDYIWRTLNNDFHAELHELATGHSSLLRPAKPVPATSSAGDLDDDLPL